MPVYFPLVLELALQVVDMVNPNAVYLSLHLCRRQDSKTASLKPLSATITGDFYFPVISSIHVEALESKPSPAIWWV